MVQGLSNHLVARWARQRAHISWLSVIHGRSSRVKKPSVVGDVVTNETWYEVVAVIVTLQQYNTIQ